MENIKTHSKAKRSRKIIQKSSGFGKSCPNTSQQSKPCGYRPCVEWIPAGWYACIPFFGTCGAGEQKRKFSCEQNGQLIQRELCDQVFGNIEDIFARSERVQNCYLLCENEDLKIGWSSWSICEDNNECGATEKVKIRTRIQANPLSMEFVKETEFDNCTVPACTFERSGEYPEKKSASQGRAAETQKETTRSNRMAVSKKTEPASVRVILWVFLFSGNVNKHRA